MTAPAEPWRPIETVPLDGSRVILGAWDDWNERWLFWEDYARTYRDGVTRGFGGMGGWATWWAPIPPKREISAEIRAAQRQIIPAPPTEPADAG